MDAGARGRRLLQRKEYAAKVSGSMDRVPDDIRDWYEIDENFFTDLIQKAKDKIKSNADARKKGPLINGKDPNFLKLPPETQQRYTDAMKNSYEPEGEMVEANAEQMKAMHDAKMRKKEDDMKKKKKVDEDCWDGYEKKGMKTMFGKRYPNCVKKTKKEEVQLEAKKSCGEGEYYCHDEKKCKPIPKGAKVGKGGMLVKEDDMKGMSVKSGHKRSVESGAGMTAKGVAAYRRRNPGSKLKTAVTGKVKPGSKAAKRRKSFCARSKSWTGPRGKAARRRWRCNNSFENELPMIIDEKKLYNGSPLSDRVAAWARKINESKLIRGPHGTYVDGQKKDTRKEPKINPKLGLPVVDRASYNPQGEMIERTMTIPEKKKKEDYVKGMKKNKKGFTKRYGKDAKSVMYATATKMAMKKEGYGDVPFRDGRVKNYLGGQGKIDKFVSLTQKGKQAFKTIPDPKIKIDGKVINPENPITKMYKTMDKVNSSYEPEGQMIEAKVDQGKDDAAKINTRNQRTFGNRRGQKGGMHTGDDMEVRRYNTKKGRGVKMKGKKDKTPVNYHKRDSEARIDAVMKSIRKEGFYQKKYAGVGKGYETVGKNKRMDKSNKRGGDSKKQYRDLHKENVIKDLLNKFKSGVNKYNDKLQKNNDAINKVMPGTAGFERKPIKLKMEGNLHSWFKGSKSKDGKGGWVNVVTGGTCASDKPGEGTPKCVSSAKRASMTKAERLSAQRRKKKADPNQQSKSGAAKPTYVPTDKPKKKKINEINYQTAKDDLPDNTYMMLRKKFGEYTKDGRPNTPGVPPRDLKKIKPGFDA